MREKPDFKTSFLTLMEKERVGGHPDAEALATYRSGELAAEERVRVHLHLTACRECAELAQDLELLTEAAGSGEEGNAFEIAAFLRALKPRLTPERSAPKTSWRPPLAMAASLALAVAGSWWISRAVTEKEMLADLSRPRANVAILDLVEDRSQRTGSTPRTVEMVAESGGVLILTPDRPSDFAAYEAKILDSGGALVRTVADLEKDSRSDTFTLWIPPGGITLGDYRVELYGLSGKRAALIAGYPLRVVGWPEAPP